MLTAAVLKWLAPIGLGAATAALVYAQAHLGSGPIGVDPFIAGIIVGAFSKLINFLTGLIPTRETL